VSQVAPRVYGFTCIVVGSAELTGEVADTIHDAGCDDASLWSEGPILYLDFHREAGSLGDAVGSAIRDVERADFMVARVEMPSRRA
jgi:hypothetical protein